MKTLLEFLSESPSRLYTIDMFQVFVSSYASLVADLQTLEGEILTQWALPRMFGPPRKIPTIEEKHERLRSILIEAQAYSEVLSFTSTTRQIARIHSRLNEQPNPVSPEELSLMFGQLRVRISEDLQDRVFFCVTDQICIQKFYERSRDENTKGFLVPKGLSDIFAPEVLTRFPSTAIDIAGACDSLIHDLPTACVFHLMRVVEVGVLRVARLADIKDPKPSWGAILDKLGKLAYRTKYEDLSPIIQPHIEIIKKLLPRLHAIQHAWRNRVSHVEDKLIPTEVITEPIALEVFNAVQAFMRMLALELPENANPITVASA